jgi:hypothetical protein
MNASIYSMHASAAIWLCSRGLPENCSTIQHGHRSTRKFWVQFTNNRQKVGNGRSLRWKKAIKLLILLALPRGLEPLFSP